MNFSLKLTELSTALIRERALREKANSIQEEIIIALQKNFPLIQGGSQEKIYRTLRDLSYELNYVLQAGVKVERNLKIPAYLNSQGGGVYLIVNRKYGLKLPRCWSSFLVLAYHFSNHYCFRNVSLENGFYRLEKGDPLHVDWIDFDSLRDDPGMDRKHLNKFLKSFETLLPLRRPYRKMKEFFNGSLRYKTDAPVGEVLLSEIPLLSKYSDVGQLEKVVDHLSEIRKVYLELEKGVTNLQNTLDEQLTDLKEFNKPFKILKKLKSA